jgi:hypothetical protein
MLIEYPFNQIPLDWRMLPFDLLVTCLYGVVNFFIILCIPNLGYVYEQLDWLNDTG